MSKPKQRPSHRKRRAHRAKAKPFARPIREAMARAAAARVASSSQASVGQSASSAMDAATNGAAFAPVVPAAKIVKGRPANAREGATVPGLANPREPLRIPETIDWPASVGLTDLERMPSVPPPIPPAVPPSGPAEPVPARAPVLARLRALYHPLMVPVVLAAVVIGVSNTLPSRTPPGSHMAPSPARSTSAPPDGTPQTATIAAIPEIKAASHANALDALAAVPASETIAALAMPAGRSAFDGAHATIAARDSDFLPRTRACASTGREPFGPVATPDPAVFGRALAAAAEAQVSEFVVYYDEYFNLRYPGGDIPSLYGVCSDVVIRAYRSLGIDLQRLVHEARVGSGDTSIDHRRTETLRRFLARHGANMPVTDFADDYLPGDIVTYDRPQNRGVQAHIAIVSTQSGPSGNFMIVHNRGWGPQIEDGLFVDHITGHYRLSGAPRLLTSWGNSKTHGPGLNSWTTLVRRAAIGRGAGRAQKPKATPRLQLPLN